MNAAVRCSDEQKWTEMTRDQLTVGKGAGASHYHSTACRRYVIATWVAQYTHTHIHTHTHTQTLRVYHIADVIAVASIDLS